MRGRYPRARLGRSRWLQPGQQQGRLFPSKRIRWILVSRVSAFFALSTQHTNSFRASGVSDRHKRSAAALTESARRRSRGSLCTTPPGIIFLALAATMSLCGAASRPPRCAAARHPRLPSAVPHRTFKSSRDLLIPQNGPSLLSAPSPWRSLTTFSSCPR